MLSIVISNEIEVTETITVFKFMNSIYLIWNDKKIVNDQLQGKQV